MGYIGDKSVEFIVFSSRRYGQPKLTKPKELKGIRYDFSVEFCKNCKCQCYLVEGDLWVKHRDWFSESISKTEAQRRGRFIYNDDFGCVVLRNEAWLRITNVVNVIQNESPLTSKAVILQAMATALNTDYIDLCVGEWERFWDTVVNLARYSLTPRIVMEE